MIQMTSFGRSSKDPMLWNSLPTNFQMGAGFSGPGDVLVSATAPNESMAIDKLDKKLRKRYGARIQQDRDTANLFVAANGSAHHVYTKELPGGKEFKAFIRS